MQAPDVSLHLHHFQPKYWDDVRTILTSYEKQYFDEYDIEHYRKKLHEDVLHDDRRNHLFSLLLMENETIVGIIIVERQEDSQFYWEIVCLAIKKGTQGKGYGRLLVQDAVLRVKKMGGKHVYAKTPHEKYNKDTESFYRHVGFSRVAVLPNYYPSTTPSHRPYLDCALYYKELT